MEVCAQHYAPAALDRATTEKKGPTTGLGVLEKKKPSHASAVIRTTHRRLVTVLTELSQLPLRHDSDRPNACQIMCDWYKLHAPETYSRVNAYVLRTFKICVPQQI